MLGLLSALKLMRMVRIILRGKIDLNKVRKHGVFGFQ